MRLVFLLLVFSCTAQVRIPGPGGTTLSGGAGYYRSLTTDHTQAGASNSTNFPITVILSNGGAGYNVGNDLKTVANGGLIQHTVTQVGGVGGTIPADLMFGTDNACAFLVPWEVESYDGTAGLLVAHVKIATLSHTSNNILYACFGNAAITTQQNVGSFSPANVWDSNYKGVWHLSNGSTLNVTDSTSNGNNGTISSATATNGQLDGGVAVTGGSFVSLPFAAASGTFTISLWVKMTANANTYNVMFEQAAGTRNPALMIDSTGAESYGDIGGIGPLSVSGVTSGVFHYLVLTGDSVIHLKSYVDGTFLGTDTGSGTTFTAANVAFGSNPSGGGSVFAGSYDAIRWSTGIERGADWITAEYNNQRTSSTFLTIGARTP